MDPILMSALIGLVPQLMSSSKGLMGQEEKFGSSYSPSQLSTIEDLISTIKGQSGSKDITQSPSYQQGQQWLQNLYSDPNFFQAFEAPIQRQFQEQTIPELANRFASMGSGGSLGSTAFRNQLAREGSNLSTNLAALRGGMQQQGIGQSLQYAQQPFSNLMQMYNQVLGKGTQDVYQPATGGFFGNIIPSLFGGMASGYGQKYGENMAGQYTPPAKPFPGQAPSTYQG